MDKHLLPVPSTLDTDRARALLKAIRQRVAEGKAKSYADILREAMAAVEQFYAGLTQPLTQERTLAADKPRDPEDFNLFGEEVRGDLEAGFNTSRVLSEATLASFNFTTTMVSRLDGKVNKLASRSQDLQHVTGVFTEDVIVAGDDFADNSKVDPGAQNEGDQADVLPGTGSMLHRLEASAASENADVVVQSNYVIYEGKFYALDGEAEPEGGQFHFANVRRSTNAPSLRPGGRVSLQEVLESGTFPDNIDGGIVHSEPQEEQPRHSLNMAETDEGAPLEDRLEVRRRILDGNPDTYWQAEHVINMPALDLEDMTYQDLTDALSSPGIDSIDLEVTVILRLKTPRVVNFIVLDPLQPGDGAWMEVTELSTSPDGDDWQLVEGFHDGNFENTLTDEANEELTEGEVGITLAPNKYHYSGKGVWTFPAVECRYLRVTLLQRVPVPAPYDIQCAELSQILTITHRGHRGTRTSNEELRSISKMNYMDTLRTKYASAPLANLSRAGRSESGGGDSYTARDAVRDFIIPFGALSGGSSNRSQTTHEWSAQNIADEWMETQWDKARYAIGIRDFRAFSYIFADYSEQVSSAYKTPKPITKITLLTDELIPKEFNANSVMRPWILYWISLDDGVTWSQIAPTAVGVTNRLDGAIIPVAININSGIPEEEWDPMQLYIDHENPTTIRLKWRLERPGSLADRTPVLKGYRLQLSQEGGL